MSWRARRQAGLTFFEYAVAGTLLAVAGSLLLEFLIRQSDLLHMAETQSDVRSRAHLALEAMMTELRHATRAGGGSPPNVSIPAAPSNTSVTFYLPADLDGNGLIINAAGALEWDALAPVQYQYVPAARQLRRVSGAATRVLANDVELVEFRDQTLDASLGADEVRIQLTLRRVTPRGRVIAATDGAIVKLRN